MKIVDWSKSGQFSGFSWVNKIRFDFGILPILRTFDKLFLDEIKLKKKSIILIF